MSLLTSLPRLIVTLSMVLGAAAGLWPLAARPAVLATALATVAAAFAGARRAPAVTVAAVLAFAYVSYGAVRMMAGPDVAAIPYFLAAFVGLALGAGPITRWQAQRAWRVPLAWWATGVAVTWPVFFVRELSDSAPLAAGPIVTAALLQMSVALWMDCLLAPAEDGTAREDGGGHWWQVPLITSALATSLAAVYQGLFDLTWLSGDPWVRLGRAVGLMGDANPLGIVTALWAPLAWTTLGRTRAGRAGGAVAAAVLWAGAWLSGARSPLILVGAGALGLGLEAARARGWSWRAVAGTGLLLGVLAAFAVVAVAPHVPAASPVGRAAGALAGASPGAAAYELLWRRDGYGAAAIDAAKAHPWFGVGIGRFAALSPSLALPHAGRTIPPDNAQNLWRQTLAEQGVLGLVPVLWLTVLTLRALVVSSPVDLTLRAMVAGLGVCLLVGYPVQDPAVALTTATLVAALARGGTPSMPGRRTAAG